MISGLVVMFPLVGMGLLWLLRRQPARVHWGASIGLSTLNLLFILVLATRLPAEFVVSSWRPPALFQAQIHLLLDRSSWAYLLAASILQLSVYLTSAARPGSDNAATRILSMGYLGLVSAAFLAANAVTVALTWALVDATSFLFLLAAAETLATVDGLTKRFSLQAASVLLIVASALPLSGLRSDVEGALRPALMVAAVFFRIGLFPLHIELPALPGVRRGVGAMVRLLPPAMGLAVLGRQLSASPPAGVQLVLLVLGALSVSIGGLRWATAPGAVQGRPFLVLTFAGLAAIAGSMGSGGRMAIVGLGVTMILVGATLSQLVIHERWHRGLGLVAALVAVGVPPTAGHLALRVTGTQLSGAVTLAILATTVVGLLLIPAGTLRVIRRQRVTWDSGEPLVRAAYGVGLALPLVASVPAGLVLRAYPIPFSAGLSAIILLGGLAAGYGAERWSPARLGGAFKGMTGVGERVPIGLARLWSLTLHRSAALMRGLGQVVEGRAAMLWIYVIVLFVALVASGGGG